MSKINLWPNIESVGQINSVAELIYNLKDKKFKIKGKDQLFYRGESQYYVNTRLIPTVFREDFLGKEYDYYYDILTNFPHEFENLSNLSRLAKMQHYWCPTRLLDLTSNPLVALYFACCDKENEKGYFYIFKTNEVLNYDSDRALILSCISHLNAEQQNSLYNFVCDFIHDEKKYKEYSGMLTNEYIAEISTHQNNDEDGCFQFERLIGEAMRERSAFANYRTVAKDLLKRYVVRPLIQNERQKKQDGLFMIFGLHEDDQVEYNKNTAKENSDKEIKVYCFEVDNKKEILKELDLLGINSSTIYCDIANRAEYLKKNKLKNKASKKNNM